MKKIEMSLLAKIDGRIGDNIRLELSRKFYRSLTNRNLIIKLNGSDALTYQICKQGDKIDLFFDYIAPNEWEPIFDHLEVLYEDDNYLIVNKPKGLLTIPTNGEPISLYQYVLGYYKVKNYQHTIHFINRLDKDTSGVVVVAKDRLSAFKINNDKTQITRKYYALCHGIFEHESGIINTNITRGEGTTRIVSEVGKESITEYKVISSFDQLSLVELHLRTGRTHQIRVHMQYLGHPIVGDRIYYNNEDTYLHLCSYYVKFVNPFTGKLIEIEIKPEWM